MSTALHEPPRDIRVGRLVKVIGKPPKLKGSAPRAEPPAPKSEEVRLLLFLGLGGAACLAVLALAGLMLVQRGSAELDEVTALTPAPIGAFIPASNQNGEAVELLPEPIAEPPEPELLPQPAEANLQFGSLALFPGESPANQAAGLVPPSAEPAITLEKQKAACEKFGTRIVFLQNPLDAFRKAREENKQVFFVHLSGNFEDQEFT